MIKRIKRFFKEIGPGVITGASDDDPSGIATYSQAGAKYGLGLLWTAIFMLPMLYVVQEMSARIGAVTGKGIAKNIKDHYSKYLLYFIVSLLVIANTINLGADLGAIASAIQLLIPVNYYLTIIVVTFLILMVLILTPYKQYSKFLKFLALSLFSYIIAGLLIKTDSWELVKATFLPQIQFTPEYLFLIVGILGTTISPFMMFWQANEEIEEEMEKRILPRKGGIPKFSLAFLKHIRFDTFIGMAFSELITWFIIMTTASTLFKHGITNIETATQAALALEPLVSGFPYAGTVAKALFALGLVGTGLLAIPILAGSTSYAVCEVFDLTEGLNKSFKRAKYFYLVILVSTIIGMLINFVGINPIKALIYAAVINGVLAIPLIATILIITNNRKIMGEYTNSKMTNIIGIITLLLMSIAVLGIFITL